jgi:hypothetical protein
VRGLDDLLVVPARDLRAGDRLPQGFDVGQVVDEPSCSSVLDHSGTATSSVSCRLVLQVGGRHELALTRTWLADEPLLVVRPRGSG